MLAEPGYKFLIPANMRANLFADIVDGAVANLGDSFGPLADIVEHM